MEQQRNPIIVTFANQKGGVGKTTLCACFANYLVNKGVRVRVIDCDRQQSIVRCRRRDLKKYGESLLPYSIEGYPKLDRQLMKDIIGGIFTDSETEIVLFDCPGNMLEGWIIPLVGNTDHLVIPFHYDDVTIASSSEFIILAEKINSSTGRTKPFCIYMIPNMQDKRVGTKDELSRWELTRERYSRHGIITPPIMRRADMERISTVSDLDMQMLIVKDSFDIIYQEIFQTSEALRPPMETLRCRTSPKHSPERNQAEPAFTEGNQ